MGLHFAKITSKSQTTVPREVREALRVGPGDTLAYCIDGGDVRISKAEPLDWNHLRSLETTLGEWNTAEDAAAFDDL